MDLAKALIRTVVRAFYETKHVLVIDALMVHSALPNEDLAFVLGMQQKDLRKLCGKLREDRLLAVHSRPEIREGLQRPINKDYYYIDFHATIDAIKYRVFNLTEKVKAMYKPTEEKKDYYCPQCGSKWSQLEVLDRAGPLGFDCHRCGGILEREEPNAGDSTGHEKQSRLMSQLEPLLKLLQQIDSEEIPNNDFENAIAHAVPIQRDPAVSQPRPTVPINGVHGGSTAVKGLTQTTLGPLDVSVTASSEKSAAEQAAEAQRKANIVAQNALPVWHTTSTITGQSTVDSAKTGESQTNADSFIKDDEEDNKGNINLNEDIKAYYDQIAQEREKEAEEDREADEFSGDGDEDDEFEDVGIGAAAPGDTPSSSFSAAAGLESSQHRPEGDVDRKKIKRSESGGSSAPVTNTSTPAPVSASQDIADLAAGGGGSSGSAAKKVKFEQQEDEEGDGENGNKSAKDSDEDDDAEFEDAL